jgi:hypothetical protein
MADHFELTDEHRSVIGVASTPYPVEFTSTGIRAFARGVGYTDPVYFDVAAAQAAGYANLPAPPCYLGIPVFIPGECDPTYGQPLNNGAPRLNHGLKGLLDGGTSVAYSRTPVAGETLMYTASIANLEVKQSPSLGTMLLVSNEQTYRDQSGAVVMTVSAQAIYY